MRFHLCKKGRFDDGGSERWNKQRKRGRGRGGRTYRIGGGNKLPTDTQILFHDTAVACAEEGAQLGPFSWMLCCVFSMGFRRLLSHAQGGGGGGGYGVYLSALEVACCP